MNYSSGSGSSWDVGAAPPILAGDQELRLWEFEGCLADSAGATDTEAGAEFESVPQLPLPDLEFCSDDGEALVCGGITAGEACYGDSKVDADLRLGGRNIDAPTSLSAGNTARTAHVWRSAALDREIVSHLMLTE